MEIKIKLLFKLPVNLENIYDIPDYGLMCKIFQFN